MAYQFSEVSEKRFKTLEPRFPNKRSLILPCLYLVQRDQGFVDTQSMQYIADRIGSPVTVTHVHGVATFYTMYNKKPVGKFHIQVCANISCFLNGSDEITATFCKELGLENGKTSNDKMFTVEEVQCLGACGYAPMAQINEDYHEFLTPDKVKTLISQMKSEKK
jgi:NADH-quinone oxidoreductase subunit E